MKPRSQPVSLKVPRAVANRLKAAARRPPGSVVDLVGDLAGSLSGPRDLGSSPKHLRGFGR
jgi:hypothetical protein